MAGSNPDPQIGGISPQDRAEALELVFSHLPPDDRRRQIGEALAHASPPDGGPFEGLIGAWRDGRLVGAVFSQIQPGRTAIVWLPRLVAGEPESTAARLLRRHVGVSRPTTGRSCPGPAANGRQGREGDVAAGGDSSPGQPALPGQPRKCSFPTALPTIPLRLRAVLCGQSRPIGASSRSHLRRARSIVRAWKACGDPKTCWPDTAATGVFDPRHWLIVRHEERDVGCLLLADHPRHDNMELLYLGLIPAARGRGWGRQLCAARSGLPGCAGRRRLVLAVDAANAPAVQTYTAVGFQAWQRRRLVRQAASLSPTIGTHRSNRLSTAAGRTGGRNFAARADAELRVFSDDFAARNSDGENSSPPAAAARLTALLASLESGLRL